MDTQQIIRELEAERDRLAHVIQLLRGDGPGHAGGRKRHLSADAKSRISQAMKKRWAERKRQQKKPPIAA